MKNQKKLSDYLEENKKIQKDNILHCNLCGRKVKVLEAGEGPLVCCGKPMKKVS